MRRFLIALLVVAACTKPADRCGIYEEVKAACVIDGLGHTVASKGCTGELVAPGEFVITLDTPGDFVFGDTDRPMQLALVTSTSGAPLFVDLYWVDPLHRHVTTYWGGATATPDQQGFAKGGAFYYRESAIDRWCPGRDPPTDSALPTLPPL